jgi:hypothetical protein
MFSARLAADAAIGQAWMGLAGAPGPSTSPPGMSGLVVTAGGYYREYANGRIYYAPDSGAWWVYGAIGQRYTDLGGPSSWLGWPVSNEEPFADAVGRVSRFERGAIYWWPDTGAIELADIVVRYRGLMCFGETDWDQGSDSDEPYVILGVVAPPPALSGSATSPIYQDVDSGESEPDLIEIYRGQPLGVAVTATVMEHDYGDPNVYRATVQKGVDAAADFIAKLPIPVLAGLAGEALKMAGPTIVDEINGLLDTGDDRIGTASILITPRQLVTLTRAPSSEFHGIQFDLESPLVSGLGASYKAYFDVWAA